MAERVQRCATTSAMRDREPELPSVLERAQRVETQQAHSVVPGSRAPGLPGIDGFRADDLGRRAVSPALSYARTAVERRGAANRQYRNTIVLIAADSARLGEVESAVQDLLGWSHIVEGAADLAPTGDQIQQAAARTSRCSGSRTASPPLWGTTTRRGGARVLTIPPARAEVTVDTLLVTPARATAQQQAEDEARRERDEKRRAEEDAKKPPQPDGPITDPPDGLKPPAPPPADAEPHSLLRCSDSRFCRLSEGAEQDSRGGAAAPHCVPGVQVRLSLDIAVEAPDGFDDAKRRVVRGNARVLRFDQSGFETS